MGARGTPSGQGGEYVPYHCSKLEEPREGLPSLGPRGGDVLLVLRSPSLVTCQSNGDVEGADRSEQDQLPLPHKELGGVSGF